MMMILPVNVRAIGGSDVLAGRLAGEAARPAFEDALTGAPAGAVIVLDFREVSLVTASYFLGAFEWVWTTAAARERDLYPLLANANEESRDEIAIALKAKGFRVYFGRWEAGEPFDVETFNLDEGEVETYEQVGRLGEATATDLFRINPKIQPTGWSNRLALLYEYRLLRRRKQGRQLIYAQSWSWR